MARVDTQTSGGFATSTFINDLRDDYVSQTDTERQTLAGRVIVKKDDGADLKEVMESYWGEKEIEVPKGTFTTEAISVASANYGVMLGKGMQTKIVLADNENADLLKFTDCNDMILDQVWLDANKANQTSGHALNLLRVRRSSIGARFLRIDNAKQDGIRNNGSGAYPNSNVVNVFGNLFIYTCDNYGFYEGGYAADDVITRAYIQECLSGGLYEGGVHLQVISAHIHECLYGIRNATHDCYHGHLNIEGSDNDGIRIDGGGGSQGMKNHFDQVFLFDNNQSEGANYSDIRCVGATAKWNTFNRVMALGYNHVKYNYSDHNVTGSGNKNRIWVLTSQDWVTAQTLLCTDVGAESYVENAYTTT